MYMCIHVPVCVNVHLILDIIKGISINRYITVFLFFQGLYGPMICLVLVGYANCNKDAAIGLLCGAVGLNGAVYSGYMNSHLDLAPNFAGTLMGITNTFATIPGFVAPQVVGMLIDGHVSLAGLCIGHFIIYLFLFF